MKRIFFFIIILLAGFGCKKPEPGVTPDTQTTNTTLDTTQTQKPQLPLLGDTLFIKLDSCQKVLDTLAGDTLVICLDSIYDNRVLQPLCESADPPPIARCFFVFEDTIQLPYMEVDCGGNPCGPPPVLWFPSPIFIDTLGYRICLLLLFPYIVDSSAGIIHSWDIPDSLYKAMVLIHKN